MGSFKSISWKALLALLLWLPVLTQVWKRGAGRLILHQLPLKHTEEMGPSQEFSWLVYSHNKPLKQGRLESFAFLFESPMDISPNHQKSP